MIIFFLTEREISEDNRSMNTYNEKGILGMEIPFKECDDVVLGRVDEKRLYEYA